MGAWASAVIDFGAVGVYAATSHDLESDGFLDDWLGGGGEGGHIVWVCTFTRREKMASKKGAFFFNETFLKTQSFP